MEQDDAALVLACRRGDQAAWEELVRRYQRLVYSIPRRAGLNEDLSAEVFQQVFATLVEKLDTVAQPERIGAWLATIARRETWAVSRRARAASSAAPGPEGADPLQQLPDLDLLPDEMLLRMEQQQHVRRALAALDERCRSMLTLLFYQPEPPPYAEVAAALGTSAGSIGPTRARCLEKLRRLLEQG